ncbi:MAG TPA: sigma-70 family RNA polymerase sigma factor [Vicinamibacteria bacterium]|nr:sigma-70 family RNA polymerase sigma factor [Vicinamibacteria bacterium]
MRGICLDGPAAGIKKFEPAQATAFLIWYEKGLRDVSASILFERYGVFLQFVSFRPFPAEACTAFASFFNEVYRANRSGYLSMFPRDHAEDVLADIYSHFIDRDYRRLREYTERPGVPFLAWFHTVAKNRAIELHRKLQIESRRRGELDRESERIPDPRPNPEDDVLRAKLRAAIQECFDRLNDRYRSVMQYVLDHPTSRDAIARALNLTTTQIYRITHEAREQLRRCLAESGF